jgi:hypothetical protein
LLLGASGSATLTAAGYDPAYGARPLRRLVEKAVLTEISKLLLGGQIPDNSVVTINGAADGRLEFSTVVRFSLVNKSCGARRRCLPPSLPQHWSTTGAGGDNGIAKM